MEGASGRLARKQRLASGANAPSSRLKRRRQKEEQKRKYIPARLLAFLFLALPAAVLAIHHVRSESGTVTVVRHEESSSRETVRIIQVDDVKAASETAKRERPADRKAVDEADDKIITHVVAANETLYSIAMKYYGTSSAMELIKKENGLATSRLEPGQTLRIPLHEER
ncbi:LysM peptidoglycan-binding domain-containing protein [Geobacillus subterraneus]|uniref:LysM peptidoglycan-binding domain-containing protein n=1 Tax=Geobacillus subterraneus TaxID=129338 RepID=UPI002AC999C0|nr:LysM peptidoglycan-binding domain-containing protein [Geobacillus subterraneus]WPZ17215.1 LysM peptidoglycan-binding domain-containing protein [Geobacillus subterraneus]